MKEDGAAMASNARTPIVIDFDDQVVEAILAPEPVPWFIGRQPKRSIVAAVSRILTPGKFGRDPRSGNRVSGRAPRSARHHSWTARNWPRGVAASPSRLSARSPVRPSATRTDRPPTISTPCVGAPGRARTRTSVTVRWRRIAPRAGLKLVEVSTGACSFTAECSTSPSCRSAMRPCTRAVFDEQCPQDTDCRR